MAFTWTYDQADNVYKNHAISSKMFSAAAQNSVFFPHVWIAEGYGKGMGETVTIERIRNITEPSSTQLVEGIRIPEYDFLVSSTSITQAEHGMALPYTNLVEQFGKFDVTSPMQMKLMDQMRLSIDTNIATAFKTAQYKYIPTGLTAATIDSNGTPSTAALVNMNMYHVEQIRDQLSDTMNVPGVNGSDEYIGIFRELGLPILTKS